MNSQDLICEEPLALSYLVFCNRLVGTYSRKNPHNPYLNSNII